LDIKVNVFHEVQNNLKVLHNLRVLHKAQVKVLLSPLNVHSQIESKCIPVRLLLLLHNM